MIRIEQLDTTHPNLDNGKIHYLIYVGDVLCGLMTAKIGLDGWIFLNDLFIEEEVRNSGLAKRLIEYSEQDTLSKRHAALGWNCIIAEDNTPSINLVESLGYIHSYTWDGNSRLYTKWR